MAENHPYDRMQEKFWLADQQTDTVEPIVMRRNQPLLYADCFPGVTKAEVAAPAPESTPES